MQIYTVQMLVIVIIFRYFNAVFVAKALLDIGHTRSRMLHCYIFYRILIGDKLLRISNVPTSLALFYGLQYIRTFHL